jgi:ribosomal protein S18 acetylase RimI-like enzyme
MEGKEACLKKEILQIEEVPLTVALKEQIYAGFRCHAHEVVGQDLKGAPVAYVSLNQGTLAGAVVVEPFWGGLHIKYAFVVEDFRGHGLGRRLMESAFEYGRQHNCPFAFVETMSFQALGFYQKLGFELEYTRTGYTKGLAFHYLRRAL